MSTWVAILAYAAINAIGGRSLSSLNPIWIPTPSRQACESLIEQERKAGHLLWGHCSNRIGG